MPSHSQPAPISPAPAALPPARRGWLAVVARSPLAWLTVACGVYALLARIPSRYGAHAWRHAGLATLLFFLCLLLLVVRSIGALVMRTLWSLRNRLLAAYVLVGVVPVLLIVAMVAITAYLFYGQYAVYLIGNQIRDSIQRVGVVNDLTARELEREPNRAADAQALGSFYASRYFPRNAVQSYFIDAKGRATPSDARFLAPPAWLNGGSLDPWVTTPGGSELGVAARPSGYTVIAYRRLASGAAVITEYPLTVAVLTRAAAGVGQMRLEPAAFGAAAGPARAGVAAPVVISRRPLRKRANVFDIDIRWDSFIPARDWSSGRPLQLLAYIDTRPSLLNDHLFASFAGENPRLSRGPLIILGVVGLVFLAIELLSLVAGIRLTRTITGAVADLYVGTEHVNRGDFEHRIPVRRRDQLAALERAFNGMVDSIRNLLREQQQKQRLENELAIAHEVQLQLFRQEPLAIPGLEAFGRCLPARIVSGDYYDFTRFGESELSLALGDISGKGISAALLMATIVSAVRAIQPAREPGREAALVGHARAAAAPRAALSVIEDGDLSPAALMRQLNHQIYRSTPPEKYATLFYGIVDARRRRLRYTNAGHLPPVIFNSHGRRRLDVGGMVVGLFDDVSYEEAVVDLDAGDLLAAWSDGITEPENEYGVEFGEPRLLDLIELHRQRPLAEIMRAVLDAVRDWSGAEEQADDITLVLARVQ